MANPFKEADKRNKVAPGGEKESIVEPIIEEPIVEEVTIPENPLAGMIEKKEQNGKSYGLYLDDEAHNNLVKLAKMNGCSKSKALNTLLRNLF